MFKPHISDTAQGIIGVIFLGSILAGSWFPRTCPLIKKALGNCYISLPGEVSSNDAELNRIPHQQTTSKYLFFTTLSQDYRTETMVNFFYRSDSPQEVAFLQAKYPDGFHDLALITHPLLTDLNWEVIRGDTYTLYQRNSTYSSIGEFLASPPQASSVAADRIAAKDKELGSSSYIPLETLTSLEPINYIFTTYPPTQKDGTWSKFSKLLDLQKAAVTADNQIEWIVSRENSTSIDKPFYISTVHVDYRKIKP